MPAPISVNLLPKDAFLDSVIGKFLLWSLSIGRYLVVFTELIVILSFISRFKLDRDLTDLNEKIQIQKQTILSYADTEAKFNSVKSRIDTIKLNQENQQGLNALNFLEQNIPIDVKLSRISFTPTSWAIEGSALSAQSLKLTVGRVVAANLQSEISLSNVKLNSRTGAIDFNIAVRHKTTAESVKTKPKAQE
jgi:hypothetical protein